MKKLLIFLPILFFAHHGYTLSIATQSLSPRFDQLLNNYNIDSAVYISEFKNNILSIINSEELDILQLDLAAAALNEINTISPSLFFTLIKNDIVALSNTIKKAKLPQTSLKVLIFKEHLEISDLCKINPTIINPIIYLIKNDVIINKMTLEVLKKDYCFKLIKRSILPTQQTPLITQNAKPHQFSKWLHD